MAKTHEIEFSYTQPQLDIFFDEDPKKYTIVTKGRRFGATHGAAKAYIEKMICGEGPFLWGDTIHGNIDRYFDRYFKTELKNNKIDYHFNRQNKQLVINDQYMDFRSADKPENWEGFGYKEIFLNEAGIILNKDYLYTNAILPMLLDFPDSRLIAAGVPKGKLNKIGGEHKFYTLYKQAVQKKANYRLHEFSSYDNPLLNASDIDDLEKEMEILDSSMIEQEIYGKFIDGKAVNPFAKKYDPERHESELAVYDPSREVFFSIDFNVNPFGCIAFQKWEDIHGKHCWVIDEFTVQEGTTSAMADEIRERYRIHLHMTELTGDHMGMNAQINRNDNNALFTDLRDELGLHESQIVVPANPRHKKSRNDVNYFLHYFDDFKINPIKCPNLCRDMRVVNIDNTGKIIKKNRKDTSQKADHLDCFTAETRVLTKNGQVPIKWVNIGDEVATRGGFKRVTDTFSRFRPAYAYEFESGSYVSCTKDHRLLTPNGNWLAVDKMYKKGIPAVQLVDDKLVYVKITSKTDIGVHRVYDITVEEEHEFFANNILAHNCLRYMVNTYYSEDIERHKLTGFW